MDVPLIAFVNTKSGGLQGTKIINKFKKCMPPENVFDLSQGGPLPGLQKFTGQKYRIVVCGGDGTVGWILSEIEKMKLPRDMIPPVAILPIGTGNDLSRVLKWGGSHNGTKLASFISHIERACVVHLDKWRISYAGHASQDAAQTADGAETAGDSAHSNAGLPHAHHDMHNYFSIGADAHIALQFHEMRTAHPERFSSRAQNMAWYVRLGLANRSPELIAPHVRVEINGTHVPLPSQTRCVVVLNLPSYSGGANPWGTRKSTKKKFARPAVDDGLLEVVAMNGPLQMVGIHANIVRGKRLGQGNQVKITTTKQFSAQVDGEPWSQPPSVVEIHFSGKAKLLANSSPSVSSSNTPSSPASSSSSPSSPSSSSGSPPPLPSNLSSPSLINKEDSQNFLAISRSISARNLIRTRSASSPVAHTPSPLKYGPVQFDKRKKGRLYCDSCGLEFYLPYMLANHHNNGLCTNPSSSSNLVKMPSTPPTMISVQLGDGTSDCEDDNGIWKSNNNVEVRKENEGVNENASAPKNETEKKEEAATENENKSEPKPENDVSSPPQSEQKQKEEEKHKQEEEHKQEIMQHIVEDPSSEPEEPVSLPGSVPESDAAHSSLPSPSSPLEEKEESSVPAPPVESLTESSPSETVVDKKEEEQEEVKA